MVVVKIARINLYRFLLTLNRPLNLRGITLSAREGLLLQIQTDENESAWGEVAPLPGFSRESLYEAEYQLRELRDGLSGQAIPPGLERLDGGFGNWLGHSRLTASVSTGIETAVLQLISHHRNRPMRQLLCDNARDSIAVNVLLHGTEDEVMSKAARLAAHGYRTFKLKVGLRPFDDDVRIVRRVREIIGPRSRLRLDANRAFDLKTALRFGDAVQLFDIDYIEEPTRDFLELLQLTNRGGFRLPIALDESLQTISPKALTQLRGVRAVILKPTLLGFEWSMWFARRAQRLGMIAVMSSTYESSLTLASIAKVCACLNDGIAGEDVAMGLDTTDIFTEDLTVESLQVNHGRVDLTSVPPGVFEVKPGLIEELDRA